MQYLILIPALLSTSFLAHAAPTTTRDSLSRRACQITYPQASSFRINYDISRNADGTHEVANMLTFNTIPTGSYVCQLEVDFPAGYPIASEGNSKVNAFDTSGSNGGSLIGTVCFASSPVAETRFVIDSATCEELVTYRMEIASDEQAGRGAFESMKEAGIWMTYNC